MFCGRWITAYCCRRQGMREIDVIILSHLRKRPKFISENNTFFPFTLKQQGQSNLWHWFVWRALPYSVWPTGKGRCTLCISRRGSLVYSRISMSITFDAWGCFKYYHTMLRPGNIAPSKHDTLGQRRRRWANSKPTLDQRLIFADTVLLHRN